MRQWRNAGNHAFAKTDRPLFPRYQPVFTGSISAGPRYDIIKLSRLSQITNQIGPFTRFRQCNCAGTPANGKAFDPLDLQVARNRRKAGFERGSQREPWLNLPGFFTFAI